MHASNGKLFLTWADIERSVDILAQQLSGREFDLYVGICRGGLIPLGLLARRCGFRNIVTVSMQRYDDGDRPVDPPVLLQSPAEPVLAGKRILIIDDVWDSGETVAFIRTIIGRVAASVAVATLHFKPNQTVIDGRPDFYAEETDLWIVYPWDQVR